jgi:hypothetical protein
VLAVLLLHRAAYNSNVKHLRDLLQRMPQEQYAQLDLHGNTVRRSQPAWCPWQRISQ